MPQETHNFTYNTNAPSVTVTATMKDAAGNILDVVAQTVDVPDVPSHEFVIDRRPIYLANFGANNLFNNFGVTEQSWRFTPVTDDTDGHSSFNTNGRIRFIQNGGILSAYQDGFRRLIVSQAGGWTNFGDFWRDNNTIGENSPQALKGYNVNAYSCMEFDHAPNYSTVVWTASNGSLIEALGNMDGTQLSDFGNPTDNPEFWIPSPFTTTGDSNGQFGNSRQAWKAALDIFWGQVSDPNEVQLYHQWDWRPCFASLNGDPEDPNTPVDITGGYDRRSMGIDLDPTIGAIRTPLVTVFDRNFWDLEVNGMLGLGFNALTWGVSGKAWEEGGNNSSLHDAVKNAYGKPYLFEAIPLTSFGSGSTKVFVPHGVSIEDPEVQPYTFSGQPDERYTISGHWGFFPSYFTNDTLNDTGFENGGRNIKNIAWNPAITEMHVIFDYFTLVKNNFGPEWSVATLKQAMAEAWQNGFIVGLSTLTNTPQTVQENQAIRQWCLALNTIASSDSSTQTSAASLEDGSNIIRPINPAASLYGSSQPPPQSG